MCHTPGEILTSPPQELGPQVVVTLELAKVARGDGASSSLLHAPHGHAHVSGKGGDNNGEGKGKKWKVRRVRVPRRNTSKKKRREGSAHPRSTRGTQTHWQSTMTATPLAPHASSTALATCSVSLSWIWRRLEKTSAMRASLLSPRTLPAGM